MLFTRYNLFKNHGDFVHLNMLKWAMKYVPELGKSTVPDDETVNLIEIGTGGIDINTHKDGTGEEKSKHVPYTDVQVNGISQPTFNLSTYTNGEASTASGVIFDRYTKVIDSDGIGKSDPAEQYSALYKGMTFYDKDTINVDGTNHKYVTKIKYLNKGANGTLTDANQDKEFRPYTSVKRDDDSLVSSVKLIHSGNKLRGINFTSTNEHYDIEVTPETLFNMVYPVGSIYMSINEVNPTTLFGGTWEKIEDRFLLGASSTNPVNATGGSFTQTLKQENIPEYMLGVIPAIVPGQHTNWDNAGVRGTTVAQATTEKPGMTGGSPITSGNQYGWSIGSNGGGQAFSIMPPYMAVNIWKRTA